MIKIMCAIFLTAVVILCACSSKNTEKGEIVGGVCSYDEFEGKCTAETINDDGNLLFTFRGLIRGKQQTLKGNETSDRMNGNQTFDCKLMFIKNGTCTPCVFTEPKASCGKEAWEAFRSLHQ